MNLKSYFVFTVIVILVSCKKNGTTPSSNSNVDVYVAGVTAINNADEITIWKNGVATYIANGGVSAIKVNGNDIYITGYSKDPNGNFVATYWKDGAATYLTGGMQVANATAIAISGADVYVAGITTGDEGQSVATYWKNGTATKLSGGVSFYSAGASDIAVEGADVFITGATPDANDRYVATYWKNNVPTYLKSSALNSTANAVAINGSDLYIVGNMSNSNLDFLLGSSLQATYWKNGVPVNLTDSISKAAVNSIIINNGSVIISGFSEDQSGNLLTTYWKNGVATRLPVTSSNFSFYSNTTSGLALQGNDIYITGFNGTYWGYWKNSTHVQLNGSIEYICGIAVVPH